MSPLRLKSPCFCSSPGMTVDTQVRFADFLALWGPLMVGGLELVKAPVPDSSLRSLRYGMG